MRETRTLNKDEIKYYHELIRNLEEMSYDDNGYLKVKTREFFPITHDDYTVIVEDGDPIHRIIARLYNKREIKKGKNVHHVDGNNKNNFPTNLRIMDHDDHF